MLPAAPHQQLAFCLTFGLLGMLLGMFYDLLRACRVYFRLRRVGTSLLDGLFCLVSLTAVLLTVLRYTDGRLRGYLGLGLACGFFLWRCSLSRGWYRLLLRLLSLLGQALGRLCRLTLWLFSFPRGN